MPDLVPLSGSERSELPGATPTSTPLDESQVITVTVMLRRRAEVPRSLVEGPETVTQDQLGAQYGADADDAQRVAEVLGQYGLTVSEYHLASRRLKVSGTIAAMEAAFGTTLSLVTSPHPDGSGDVQHRYRTGPLSVPAPLSGIVVAVLGLDDRPQARPQFRRGPALAPATTAAPETVTPETVTPEVMASPDTTTAVAATTADPEAAPPASPASPAPPAQAARAAALTAPEVASFYQFPAGTDGTGQAVAIIELGGGYTASDLSTYFSGLGLSVPPVTAVGVDGGSNSPGQQADGEVELDIEVVGAVAPGAAQYVYFATNTDQGFLDAIADAVHATPTPVAVSISWGQSEDQWSSQTLTAMDEAFADAAALGVTVTVAAGDNGSSDDPSETTQVHCDFPASSPHALACGGTKLIGNTTTFAITSEVVWNELASNEGAGGGGVSDVFPVPSYQTNAGVPTQASTHAAGRGVPDVAGNADPVTGYLVVVDGTKEPIGGTSAVAPLWAGLIARLAQATGKKFGLLQPMLYAGVAPGVAQPGFNDIVSGSNGAYSAGPGWDACTGLGSPNGTALLSILSGTTPTTGS